MNCFVSFFTNDAILNPTSVPVGVISGLSILILIHTAVKGV